jgi:immunity protein Imm1 of predicted polymorphic toxin system
LACTHDEGDHLRKSAYFASRPSAGWPPAKQLERYFLAPSGQRWFFETENDSANFTAEGVDGTEHLEADKGRIDVDLDMWGNPEHGVLLIYSKWGGGLKEIYSSKGDLARLGERVRTMHDTVLPIGLFIPFEKAWTAVKEFIETDGKLPGSIEWIANRDLPPNTFPDP